jgi:hypothetical protein
MSRKRRQGRRYFQALSLTRSKAPHGYGVHGSVVVSINLVFVVVPVYDIRRVEVTVLVVTLGRSPLSRGLVVKRARMHPSSFEPRGKS